MAHARPTRLDRPVDMRRDHVLGDTEAELTPVEYGSYSYPYCRAVHGVIADLEAKECPMSPGKRYAKQHAKARQRRRLKAQERLERDRRQAQQATKTREQRLGDLGLSEDLVAEVEGRLRRQQKLLGKIGGVRFPPLFGCRTNVELCRFSLKRYGRFVDSEALGLKALAWGMGGKAS